MFTFKKITGKQLKKADKLAQETYKIELEILLKQRKEAKKKGERWSRNT